MGQKKTPEGRAPGEPIEHLTIIERGIAAKEGRLKIKGTAIGVDMIIDRAGLRDWSPVA